MSDASLERDMVRRETVREERTPDMIRSVMRMMKSQPGDVMIMGWILGERVVRFRHR